MRWMLLSLLLSFTILTKSPKILLLEEQMVMVEPYRTEATDELAAKEKEAQSSEGYYGCCRITFYCPCSQCCGSWGNATASGAMPTAGRTVANGSLPFGTRVLIDGVEYVVEDRGVGGDQFDIFVNSHDEALRRGLYYTDVWILE